MFKFFQRTQSGKPSVGQAHRATHHELSAAGVPSVVLANRWINPMNLRNGYQWFVQSLTQYRAASDYLEPLIQLVSPGYSSVLSRTQIIEIREEDADTYSLVLRPGRGWKAFQAGQHIQLTVEQNGSLQNRTFTVSSSPAYFRKTGLIELTIRKQSHGRITPWIPANLSPRDRVLVSGANGEFVIPSGEKPLLMIAGGSGITPFRSMLNELAAKKSQRIVTLLFYVRNHQHRLFESEFADLQRNHPNLNIHYLHSDQVGFIGAEHIRQLCPDYKNRHAMICGPTAMIKLAKQHLTDMQCPDISYEYFGAAPIDADIDLENSAQIKFQRSALSVSMDEPTSLLDIAEQQGLNPVSGCRVGVCHQCKCQKVSGVVYNTRTGKYSDTGAEDIQLCVSVATNQVVLDL